MAPGLDLAQARVLAAAGQTDEALGILSGLLAARPARTEVRLLMADIAMSAGRNFEAIVTLEPQREAAPEDPSILFRLAAARLVLGEFAVSESLAREGLRLQPQAPGGLLVLGRTLLEQGRVDEAAAVLRQAVTIAPNVAHAHAYLGAALDRQDRKAEARAAFDTALRLYPGIDLQLADRARALVDGGQAFRGLDYLDLALQLRPDSEELLNQRVDLAEVLGLPEVVLNDLTTLAAGSPNDVHLLERRGGALLQLGRIDLAMADFRQALALETENMPALAARIVVRLREAGRIDDIGPVLADALAKAPLYGDLILQQAIWLEDTGQRDASLAEFARLARYGGSYPGQIADHAEELQDRGDLQTALALYELLVSAWPMESERHEDLAQARAAMGDFTAALAEYDRAIALDPRNRTAYRYRGDARVSLGDPVAAIADYTRAIEVDPEYYQAFRQRANAQMLRPDIEAAISDYKAALQIRDSDAGAIIGLAEAYFIDGQPALALAGLVPLLSEEPENLAAHFLRGRILLETGDLPAAVAELARARDLGSDYAPLFLFLAESPDQPEVAHRHLQDHLATLPDGAWPGRLATALLGQLAPEALRAAAADKGERCEAVFYPAYAAVLKDQDAASLTRLKEAIRICPLAFIESAQARAALVLRRQGQNAQDRPEGRPCQRLRSTRE